MSIKKELSMQIPCIVMRGGSSKGLFFHRKDLPSAFPELQRLLLKAMGSPDPRQIDGMGGADPLTSRVGIIAPSERPDADVEFQFALVHIKEPLVECKGTCGNMMSAVGPFAIDEGLVQAIEPITEVRIYDVNTKKIILARVPVENGKAKVEGTYRLPGVPGTGARIDLHFYQPEGTYTGRLLPTGRPLEPLSTPLGNFEVSMVDAVAPVVFVRAKDLDLTGQEMPQEIDGKADVLQLLEAIRQAAAERLHIESSAFIPKVVFVSASKEHSLTARMMALGKMHKAYAVSCGICTAIASLIPDTVVYECAKKQGELVRIAHPAGTIDIGVHFSGKTVREVVIPRTARRIFKGSLYV